MFKGILILISMIFVEWGMGLSVVIVVVIVWSFFDYFDYVYIY